MGLAGGRGAGRGGTTYRSAAAPVAFSSRLNCRFRGGFVFSADGICGPKKAVKRALKSSGLASGARHRCP